MKLSVNCANDCSKLVLTILNSLELYTFPYCTIIAIMLLVSTCSDFNFKMGSVTSTQPH